MEDLVSVVVPVYNAEQYVKRCVYSIIKQTYKNIEIILVDDGSTDSSGDICDGLQYEDGRIRTVHKANGGLSDARNLGLKEAKGSFVMFVDSDDLVAENIVLHLVELIKDYQNAIGVCDPIHCFSEKDIIFDNGNKLCTFTSESAIVELLYQKSFLVTACCKLYPIDLFDNIKFPIGKRFEDSAIMYMLFDKVEKIVYSNAKLYAYMHRNDSLTTQKFSIKDCDILDICNDIVEYFRDRSNELKRAADSYQIVGALRIYLSTPNIEDYQDIIKYSKMLLKQKGKSVLRDRNAREKTRLGLLLYFYGRPVIKILHKRVNRWR